VDSNCQFFRAASREFGGWKPTLRSTTKIQERVKTMFGIGIAEMLILLVVLGVMAGACCAVVFVVIFLTKNKNK
jgi:hypothetical protein